MSKNNNNFILLYKEVPSQSNPSNPSLSPFIFISELPWINGLLILIYTFLKILVN